MTTKNRTRKFRIEQERKHRDGSKNATAPKEGRRKDAYQQNKRNATRAALRDPGAWM